MIRPMRVLPILLAASASSAMALTDEEIFRDFRFNLINPGARSLALGGAFISLADDATAAQANPAGLSYLRKQEYFVELRAVDNGGSADLLRESLPAGINTAVGTGTDLDDFQSGSFLSAVFPVKRVTLAVSRQEVLNTRSRTLNSFAFTFTGSPGFFSAEGSGSIDVRQTNWNASGGFRVSDRLAFGASVALARLTVRSEVENFVVDTSGTVTGQEILVPTLDLRTHIDDSDSSIGFSVGALYRPFKSIGFGAVYRRAPKFSVREVIDPNGIDPDGDGVPEGVDSFGVRALLGNEFDNEFNIPDSYGVGVNWRPHDKLTFALDVERVEYSDLVDGYVPGVNILTGFDAEFRADDATEYRLGGEYVLLLKQRFPLALRGGLFTQADNTVRALNTGSGSFATADSFPGKEREVHGAAGIGLGLGRWKIDAAIDLGDSDNEYLVSFIFQGK